MVDVIARLRDANVSVPGLSPSTIAGTIVSGTVRLGHVRRVRRHPNVVSLKAARILRPSLDASVARIRLTGAHLATLNSGIPLDGSGVLVGVVDGDFDFRHQAFRDVGGNTRVLAIWDQRGGPSVTSPPGMGYGRVLDQAALNGALQSGQAFAALSYAFRATGHGTHVADIAAGSGRGTGTPGVAPHADLAFVQLAQPDGIDGLGNSKQLLDAVQFIFDLAAQRGQPAVVNVSLCTHGGPHDGSTLVESAIDAMLDRPGRALVLAAGNGGGIRNHAAGTVPAAGTTVLRWAVPLLDQTDNELEVWYPSQSHLHVTLVSPAGQPCGPTPLGEARELLLGVDPVGRILHRASDPNTPLNHLDVLLTSVVPSGVWRVELTSLGPSVDFHAWIERDDAQPSQFTSQDADPNCSLSAIANGRRTIAVSAFDARMAQGTVWAGSSRGPTRDGRNKPEVCAPGVAIRAAAATGQSGATATKSGTSMAAPHVTGLVALMLQARPGLTADQIRTKLIAATVQPGYAWDPQLGFGRVDGHSVLHLLLAGP